MSELWASRIFGALLAINGGVYWLIATQLEDEGLMYLMVALGAAHKLAAIDFVLDSKLRKAAKQERESKQVQS